MRRILHRKRNSPSGALRDRIRPTTYLRFLEWVGGWFVYGHDISVIADRAIGGFFLVGWVLIAASIGVAYVTRGSQSVGGE